MVGPPFLLEIGRPVQRRGLESALAVLETIDKYEIELADLDLTRLLSLVDEYVAHGVAGRRYRFDLLHYASATLLNCGHLASWDREHFSERVAKRINEVNSLSGLITLKVGSPTHIERSLPFD